MRVVLTSVLLASTLMLTLPMTGSDVAKESEVDSIARIIMLLAAAPTSVVAIRSASRLLERMLENRSRRSIILKSEGEEIAIEGDICTAEVASRMFKLVRGKKPGKTGHTRRKSHKSVSTVQVWSRLGFEKAQEEAKSIAEATRCSQ